MHLLPLQPEERLFLQSRLIFALALGLVFGGLSLLAAFQIMETSSGIQYIWMGGLIIALAVFFGAVRVLLRLLRDLRAGEKQVISGRVDKIELKGRKAFVKVGGRGLHLSARWSEKVEKGKLVHVYLSKSGVFLALELTNGPEC